MINVVRRAYKSPYTIQSDFARTHAAEVAMAASAGLITTRIGRSTYGRHWRVTTAGLRMINESELSE